MRLRFASIVASLLPAASAFALQQGTPPSPKISTPSGWPVIGYLIAALLFGVAITLSLKTTTRSEVEESGA
jgi:hypothetical protein